MNRKHNPMVALVALLLLAVLLLLIGCSAPAAAAPEVPSESKSGKHFNVDWEYMGLYMNLFIITDAETGVQYLAAENENGIGLTVLQPAPEEVTTS